MERRIRDVVMFMFLLFQACLFLSSHILLSFSTTRLTTVPHTYNCTTPACHPPDSPTRSTNFLMNRFLSCRRMLGLHIRKLCAQDAHRSRPRPGRGLIEPCYKFIHLTFGAESPNGLKLLISDEKASSRHYARFSNTVPTQLPRVLCDLHGATSCGVRRRLLQMRLTHIMLL